MNKRLTFLFLVLIISLYVFITLNYPEQKEEFVKNKTITNYSDLLFHYNVIKYPSNVSVTRLEENVTLGFVTDEWNLNFGMVPVNLSYAKRFIMIKNSEEKSQKISFEVHGSIKPLVVFNKNNFVLSKDETEEVEVYLFTNSTKVGNYSGEIYVKIQKPKYDFLYSVLGWS